MGDAEGITDCILILFSSVCSMSVQLVTLSKGVMLLKHHHLKLLFLNRPNKY